MDRGYLAFARLHTLQQASAFFVTRWTSQSDPINALDLACRIVTRFALHSIRKITSKLSDSRIVHQMQCLRSNQRFSSLQTIRIHRRQIETLQQRGRMFAKLLDVDTAPLAGEHQSIRPHLHGIRRTEASLIELPGHQQQRIAQRFGFHASQRHAREQTVVVISDFLIFEF